MNGRHAQFEPFVHCIKKTDEIGILLMYNIVCIVICIRYIFLYYYYYYIHLCVMYLY